tara:strand:- start:153 stop:305 length:153 start_codon:yes stop_codon:yes gene_type:complete
MREGEEPFYLRGKAKPCGGGGEIKRSGAEGVANEREFMTRGIPDRDGKVS